MLNNPWGSTSPPHGWIFKQPQMGWDMPNPVSQTISSATKEIIKMRLKNPALTAKHNLATNFEVVQDELIKYTAMRTGTALAPPTSFTNPLRSLPQAVEGLAAAVKKTAQGGALLLEWEESGQPPVDPDTASRRASFCVECPKNGKGDMTRWYTIPVSEMLRKRMARVHAMKLTTPYDDQLGVCEGCLCPLKLKVWTPMDLIQKRLKPEQRKELWEKCWVLHPPLP